ncbi:MAG: aldo/keto reductase [Bacteroidales bacterium]|nr:aldo/keto reductase [Bacteroidales bacterium]
MDKFVRLNDGNIMPMIGFGTYQMPRRITQQCVELALEMGYRHIDTAQCYGNEHEVGLAVKASGIKRENVFITTKLWTGNGYGGTMRSIEESLRKLDLDYIDLFLIHEPSGDYVSQYQAMEDAKKMGLLHSLGVANFMAENYLKLIGNCKVVPAVDQIETHVYRQQTEMHQLLTEHGTWHESWSPLACGQNGFFHDSLLKSIAETHGRTIAQVGLRWLLQRGIDVIPKTIHSERMKENLDIFNFQLTEDEMLAIASLDTGRSQFGWW